MADGASGSDYPFKMAEEQPKIEDAGKMFPPAAPSAPAAGEEVLGVPVTGQQEQEGEAAAKDAAVGVLVTDLSAHATEANLRDFFQFSGTITGIEMSVDAEGGHRAKIFFDKQESADTACLLTGAIILDKQVIITSLVDGSAPPVMGKKAVDTISMMLSQGFVFGKSTLDKISTYDKKIGLSEKVKANVAKGKEKFAKVDDKYQFSSKGQALVKSLQTKVNQADEKFQVSTRLKSGATSVKTKMDGNKYVQKGTKGLKFGFNTITANLTKVKNATQDKIKQHTEKK